MARRLTRFVRLLQRAVDRELLLKQELRRLRQTRQQIERDLQAAVPPPCARVMTAAAHANADRHRESLARRQVTLRQRGVQSRQQEARQAGRLLQVTQARRALEKLTARLQAAQETQRRREEQHSLDDFRR